MSVYPDEFRVINLSLWILAWKSAIPRQIITIRGLQEKLGLRLIQWMWCRRECRIPETSYQTTSSEAGEDRQCLLIIPIWAQFYVSWSKLWCLIIESGYEKVNVSGAQNIEEEMSLPPADIPEMWAHCGCWVFKGKWIPEVENLEALGTIMTLNHMQISKPPISRKLCNYRITLIAIMQK